MNSVRRTEIKILVVDDDPTVVAGRARLLEQAGYGVLRAADGETALQAVREHRPDLLLLDRHLPDLNGLEVCRRIKCEPALVDVLVVIVSGSAVASEEQSEGLEGGADGYISCPIANRELLARVDAFVRIACLSRTLRRRETEAQQAAAAAVRSSEAALNLIEDALDAQQRVGVANQKLRGEIAERELAQAALRASEERYRLLFDQNPLAMWVYDIATLRILAVNESAVQRYGYTATEFLGLTLPQLCHPEDVAALQRRIAADDEARSSTCELRHRRKDGTTFFVESFSRPLVFAGHHARLSLVNDITEKKLMEEKFLRAQRLESLGMLAAGISHDLNNVLAPIIFAAPMLRSSLSTPRDLKILETLERSAERGAGLVRQILGFVRTTSGEFRPTQVKHLARDLISVIEETFPKSIQFEHLVPSGLWPVVGNATQIHQVLLNLCVNARDAMPQGGTLRLVIANHQLDEAEAALIPGTHPGPWLMIEVGDTGTGMPPEVLEHIWTPFFTTKTADQGTGLGLATVRSIVAGHGGGITLQTAPGQGTIFRVYLPAEEGAVPKVSGETARSPRGHSELVLVVDDDAAVRELATFILEGHGYHVLVCADGLEAMEQFSKHGEEVSILVTDVDMPRLGGVTLAQSLLPMFPKLRIIAMSGLAQNASGGSDVPAIRTLAHVFLNKPFAAEELLNAVHGLLHPEDP
jgi:PAS domain S-box-containing protein